MQAGFIGADDERLNGAQRRRQAPSAGCGQCLQAQAQLLDACKQGLTQRITLFDQGERPEAVDSIETTLVRAGLAGENKWVFTLADESVWRQIDSDRVNFRNRPGEAVRVRRASLGSYLMTIGNSRAVRVRRQ